ncbi:protein-export membrane protein SecF [candidate division WOR-1 bacterium RIFOXYD2_FULL_36_8]|uniref:Protein-export membrane protein SecF n=1 Tax=candidate division WOR-1 bacterium RIFOXYB2_FULL_36_35 TaxID=1802578 RepID=A0A1F4S8Q4_UNCSA|nr:MAG: protein-export membrane protein SecF [candidate division WOR-1 bacterium RIFOXYA2_FULL_36_21]OGC16810.1 MAG: protein-export membrane protein SecF [candidate division WOR-1 bacterium RIFOXYB2_FULL_36_35]OGC19825.1 MAG: protein-export membrane protein SecF [candidate division WOR-1 bacterium RIFOXYA12_FULL_36_13]OGC37315.1 MAG: protein-export membrane protein SecF [candidate division WOR-1 bacterium RIFOXYD2_FULL_36_8]
MNFNIIKKTKLWFSLSLILIIVGWGGLVFNSVYRGSPMNFGIDFTGGTLINLHFTSEEITQNNPVDISKVRKVLNSFNLGEAVIQRSGYQDVFIRTLPLETEMRQKIVDDLNESCGGVELLEVDTVGPVIGAELRSQAFWALILASIGILIYVSFRFEFIYAVAALVALIHDAFITIGIMGLLWRNIDISFVAAILTILGYSINDTIVIFDRIRENMKKPGARKIPFAEVVNKSIWETMARSINTVLTVLVIVLSLLFFGGATLREFCLTLLIGFIAGTYSSVFIASPMLVALNKKEK